MILPPTLYALLLLAAVAPASSSLPYPGGRDVSVAMFSTHPVHAVTLSPAGAGAWTASCPGCRHQPLTAPLHLRGPADLYAGGPVRVTEDGPPSARNATAVGLWHLRSAADDELDIVLTLPSERYTEVVVNAEAAADDQPAALEALAIAARTYALNGTHYSARPGHLAATLCDSTECQALRTGAIPGSISAAVRATAGETLWFAGARADVFFSQNCGGITEDATAVWPRQPGRAYLRSHPDPFCVRRDRAHWHAEVPLADFAEIARREAWRLPPAIASARVTRRSASHRALQLAFTGRTGEQATLSASALRFGIGRALGWNKVRSDAYDIAVRGGLLVFDGQGYGHGVGLCQAGAAEMAREGKTARETLAFYFPGTTVGIGLADHGWTDTAALPLHIRNVTPLLPERLQMLREAWTEAQQRFPGAHAMPPTVTFAPTTELFRQMTAQPGWELASTQGDQIVLQPPAVFSHARVSLRDVLLHEMLHVLVEAESTPRAPLWLREGLVECLAAEPAPPHPDSHPLSAGQTDAGLGHADTWAASQAAHRAAAARVRTLAARYGIAAVRSWLRTGVPAGVA